MIIDISFIQQNLKQRMISTDTASYLDFHIKIDREWRLKTNGYNKRDDFTFPIVNFPFIVCNIPTAPAYILHVVRYTGVCAQ
jgi:hypothetical protein